MFHQFPQSAGVKPIELGQGNDRFQPEFCHSLWRLHVHMHTIFLIAVEKEAEAPDAHNSRRHTGSLGIFCVHTAPIHMRPSLQKEAMGSRDHYIATFYML